MYNFNNYVHDVICMALQPLDTTCSLKPPVQDDPMTRPASSLRLWPPPVAPVFGFGTTCMAPTSIPLMSTPRVVDNWELQYGATQVKNGNETAHSTRLGWDWEGGRGGNRNKREMQALSSRGTKRKLINIFLFLWNKKMLVFKFYNFTLQEVFYDLSAYMYCNKNQPQTCFTLLKICIGR